MSQVLIIMSPREQFIKCILCVLLYLIVCFLLLKLKSNFYIIQQSNQPISITNYTVKESYPSSIPDARKSVNEESKLSKRNELNRKAFDLEENAIIQQRISSICNKNDLKNEVVIKHFLYSPRFSSLYCWIRKVASTTFTKLFLDMNNYAITSNYYRAVDFLAPKNFEQMKYLLNNMRVFKLLIVRHPFQRLVSSYRDRIEDNMKHTAQAWIYAKKIFHLTRPELFRSNVTTGNFLNRAFTPDRRLKIVPTFREFSEWLLQSTEEDDVHWNHYYSHCAVCNISYDYILKLDDYTTEEISYIFAKFGLYQNTVYLSKLQETRGGNTDFHTACKYFRNLTQDMVKKLYERYRIDFEMYNYDLKKYMFCAHKDK